MLYERFITPATMCEWKHFYKADWSVEIRLKEHCTLLRVWILVLLRITADVQIAFMSNPLPCYTMSLN